MLHAAARNAFNAFDKKSEERIKVGDIESTMKKLGHNIKSGWLEKIESTIDVEGSLNYFQLSTFQNSPSTIRLPTVDPVPPIGLPSLTPKSGLLKRFLL